MPIRSRGGSGCLKVAPLSPSPQPSFLSSAISASAVDWNAHRTAQPSFDEIADSSTQTSRLPKQAQVLPTTYQVLLWPESRADWTQIESCHNDYLYSKAPVRAVLAPEGLVTITSTSP